ncbi:MAG: DUF2520 domain-containing protein [Bacteroidales bacterium]|jgi:predicted short-subunit dehydrogenase-like oxidoreductase (DUF2520 family)|nr:DUF2520 domain-containing protein [Bacteroidales bacterium]
MTQLNISFAGAGRVAEALCSEMFKAGHRIIDIVSPGEKNGRLLASRFNAQWSDRLLFNDNCDLIIVAVPDNSLEAVLSEIICGEQSVIVHTAGSFGMDIFQLKHPRKGVLYPLQTFTKGRDICLSGVPFFIEAADEDTFNLLDNLVGSIGGESYAADTLNRKMLHLAAVFACNFVNHNLTVARQLAGMGGFGFSVLEPLIRETVNKALDNGPEYSQTGPAVRNDSLTISGHLQLLSSWPGLRNMYTATTESIINHSKKTPDDKL